jgi:uncharacterized membrane protein
MSTHEIVTTEHGRQTDDRTPAWQPLNREKLRPIAQALGWLSVGMGVVAVACPKTVSRLMGLSPRPTALRLMGLRDVALGVGILKNPSDPAWLWARTAADLSDLAMVRHATNEDPHNARLALSAGATLGVTLLDAICAQQTGVARQHAYGNRAIRFSESVVINRGRHECYRFWRDIERFPTFMPFLKSVRVTDDGRSHWIVDGTGKSGVSWDAEITEDIPGERIAWRSAPGSEIDNAGSVRFERAAGDRGTVVRVRLQYDLPGHEVGSALANALGKSPQLEVYKGLRRVKQLLETGEIATTEGQPAGRAKGPTRLDRAMQN